MVGVRRQNGTVQKLSKHHAKGTLQTVSTSDREVTCHSPANTATPESSLHPAAPETVFRNADSQYMEVIV